MNTKSPGIIDLPRAAMGQLAVFARRSPAFQPIIDRLPVDFGAFRLRCEQLLVQLLRRALHSPGLSADDAAMVLDHAATPESVTEEELHLLASGKNTCRVYDLWSEVWEHEDDSRARDQARYYAALLARLYRLECQARFESCAT